MAGAEYGNQRRRPRGELGEIIRVYSAKLNVSSDELVDELNAVFTAMTHVLRHAWLRGIASRRTREHHQLVLSALMSEAYCLHLTRDTWQVYGGPEICFCQRVWVTEWSGFIQLQGPERALLFCNAHDLWDACKKLFKNHKMQSASLWKRLHRWLLEQHVVTDTADPEDWWPLDTRWTLPEECKVRQEKTCEMMCKRLYFLKIFGTPAREYYCPAAQSTFDNFQTSVDKHYAREEEGRQRWRAIMRLPRARCAQHYNSGREVYQAEYEKNEGQDCKDVDERDWVILD